jgi:glucosylceramidase
MMTSGILLAAMAATHFASVEGDEWKSSPLQHENMSGTALELFATDGKTPRAGSVPWRAWGTTFNELDLDALRMLKPAEQDEILKKLFAPKGELRFTRGRLTMNANDYSREWYSCSEKEGDFELKHFNITHDKENQIALIKMAQKFQPKLTFWVSPWSPPAWMKINKDYCVLSSRFNNQPKEKDALLYGGGESDAVDPNEMWLQGDRRKPFPRRLATQNYFIQDPRYLQAYANMFCKFIDLYAAEGIPIDMVMYQNEAYSYTPYPGCAWTAEGTIRFNKDYLAPTLRAKHPEVKLYVGTFNTNRQDYVQKIVESLKLNVEGLGFQWEGRENLDYMREHHPDLHMISSESECGNGQMDWRAGEHTFYLLHEYIGRGCDEYYNWNFILCDQGRSAWGWKQNALVQVITAPVGGSQEGATYRYTPEYYAYKHFSHFVEPGSTLLAFYPLKEGLQAIVFQRPDGKRVVICGNINNEVRAFSIPLGKKYLNTTLAAHSFNTFVER